MKPLPGTTLEQLVAALRRTGWLTDAELRIVDERWRREAGDTADAGRYTRWLVARQFLTEDQVSQLLRCAAEPPAAAPALPASPIMNAVIVAPPANARADRRTVPTAAAAPPDPEAMPESVAASPLPIINVELVPLHFEPAPPAVDNEISVELVPLEQLPAPLSPQPQPASSAAANVELYLLLGALGLFLAQLAGWVVGLLLALVS